MSLDELTSLESVEGELSFPVRWVMGFVGMPNHYSTIRDGLMGYNNNTILLLL